MHVFLVIVQTGKCMEGENEMPCLNLETKTKN